MKKFMLALVMVLALGTFPVFALDVDLNEGDVLGGKVDLPKLVKIVDGVYVGVEGSKNLYNTNINEGWTGYVKATVDLTLIDFSKK